MCTIVPFLALHDGAIDATDHGMGIDHQFRLRLPSYNDTRTETVERTLKT